MDEIDYPRYTVEPGRCIYFNSRPFIRIELEYFGRYALSPAQADALVHRIAELLNRYGA